MFDRPKRRDAGALIEINPSSGSANVAISVGCGAAVWWGSGLAAASG
jgi:hypothetical protein